MKPLVSVLMPAYNAEQSLAESIESVLSQTWKEIELIIVDDGSTDNTLELAKRYESKSVKVICQSNKGQSASENQALREAQGEFVQYLDADDLLASDKVERQMEIFREGNLSYVSSCEWSRFYRSVEEALFIPQILWTDLEPVDWLLCAWENHLMMHGAAWLIPRGVVERAGEWNESLSLINDFDYFSRVLLASDGIKFCKGARTYYRSGNTGSLSGSKSYAAWQSAFRSLELGTSSLLARENNDRTRRVCATVFQRFVYEVYPQAPDLVEAAKAKVQQFGGSDLQPSGGPTFQLLAGALGWQQATQLRNQAYQYGYARAALGWRVARALKRI